MSYMDIPVKLELAQERATETLLLATNKLVDLFVPVTSDVIASPRRSIGP
jgi:predicted ThiF/HesA family dinucleotide-utilizing enzyme